MPNREIRERLRFSKKVARLSDSEFRLFVLLMTCADDFGRYDADPMLIKSMCYPYDRHSPAKVGKCLAGLAEKEMIQLYEVDGKSYLFILQWKTRIRATKSKFPEPPEYTSCQTHDGQVSDTRRPITHNDNGNDSTSSASKSFDEFWSIYPRKVGKKTALQRWISLNCETIKDKIIAAVKAQSKSKQWNDVQYIPHPTTWLNQGRWDDEVKTTKETVDPITGRVIR